MKGGLVNYVNYFFLQLIPDKKKKWQKKGQYNVNNDGLEQYV